MSTLDESPDDFAELPAWALRALESADAKRPPQASWDDLQGEPGWPLLVDAAVVSTFLPQDLAPSTGSDAVRSQAESLVLRFSQAAFTKAGPAWELTREARSAVLSSAIRSGEIGAAVGRTTVRFHDAVSVALRDTLSAKPVDIGQTAELASLEARRAATALVSSVAGLTPPASLNLLDRHIRQLRLIEQFERMCGTDYELQVVGRYDELDALRGYVGSIGADSVTSFVGRVANVARRAIVGRLPYVLWGTGGVGKTTLISRFMLEHIRAAQRNFPFAYLDFDRPSLSPRDPYGLLSEICQQVSSQFEELDGPLSDLRTEVLSKQPRDRNSDSEALAGIDLLISKFRVHVDTFLDSQESFFEWSRPFLLVFDTFEVAQYDVNQVALLERFMAAFTAPSWPRLRLIISGRRQVQHFITSVEVKELEGIDVAGASTLLGRLTSAAGKPISENDAEKLAKLLAIKRSMLATPRVHPLRVRMVADVFRTAKEDGGTTARSLISELESGLAGDGEAARTMIDGILVRRIIGHVSDDRVKALADPGLVVRRITPGVIQNVMARGTPRPGTIDVGDSLDFEPWGIDERDARDIFTAFEKELTLVEPEGSALRHRQDVRNEMLPLIRAAKRKRFDLLHRLAFAYFEKEASLGDEAASAEAIYHGLWSEQPLEQLDHMWVSGNIATPRIDPEEFPSGSVAAIYLKARNREGLTLDEVGRLPGSIAARWAVSFGDQFLLTRTPTHQLDIIRVATGQRFQALHTEPATAAIVARLLYRAGLWRDARKLVGESIDAPALASNSSFEEARTSLIRLGAALAAKVGAPLSDLRALTEDLAFKDPTARVEVLGHAIIGSFRAGLEQLEGPTHELERAVARPQASQWARVRRILKLALVALAKPDPKLVALWVGQGERTLPRDPDVVPVLEAVFAGANVSSGQKLARSLSTRSSVSEGSYVELDGVWQQNASLISNALRKNNELISNVRRLAVFDHSDWHNVLANALARDMDKTNPGLRSLLREHRFSGSSPVQAAVAGGRFLELARTVAKASAPKEAEAVPSSATTFHADAYPQSASGVARALIGWHETLLRMVTGDQLRPGPDDEAGSASA